MIAVVVVVVVVVPVVGIEVAAVAVDTRLDSHTNKVIKSTPFLQLQSCHSKVTRLSVGEANTQRSIRGCIPFGSVGSLPVGSLYH